MRPIDFILKIDKRWTFSTVTAEIQAQLGLKLLMKSGFSSLPEKETKALKVTYKKLTEKSVDKMKEIKLNKIVKDVVSSLILNIYQISIIKDTASYFGKDIGVQNDIEKNWNLLASNWHNLESFCQGTSDLSQGAGKECDEINSENLCSLLKWRNGLHSISGMEN
ncbi:hypothetical protein BY996DRAFT_7634671 [Phakopsora pachyrhizi]|nr:hypothetical protein BY996DRAFT_7634671 [Phakopsora pachyrhizi]